MNDTTPEQVRAELEQQRRERNTERARAHARTVLAGFARAHLDGLDAQHQHREWLTRWCAQLPRPPFTVLVFGGRTGSGKTHAAAACLMAAADSGVDVGMVRFVDWLARLQPDGDDSPAWQVRAEATGPQVLLVDDLAAELTGPASDHARRHMTDLLSERQAAGRVTLFTTNLTPGQVEQVMGDRFWSRLNENGRGLRFTGPDRRVTGGLSW